MPVSGAKNSALKLMAATLLAPGKTTLRNVPDISDVHVMGKVLKGMGATIDVLDEHTLEIDTSQVDSWEAPYELVAKMRASTAVMGPLLGRFHRARSPCRAAATWVLARSICISWVSRLWASSSTPPTATSTPVLPRVCTAPPSRSNSRAWAPPRTSSCCRARTGHHGYRQRCPRARDRRPCQHAQRDGCQDRRRRHARRDHRGRGGAASRYPLRGG